MLDVRALPSDADGGTTSCLDTRASSARQPFLGPSADEGAEPVERPSRRGAVTAGHPSCTRRLWYEARRGADVRWATRDGTSYYTAV
jgi:hypothetical protein